MFTGNVIEVQRRATIGWPRQTKAVRVLRIAAGLAACPVLLGCVTDPAQNEDLAVSSSTSVALNGAALGSAKSSGEPMSEDASVMMAKARALAFADPSANQSKPQIDPVMLAMRSNPGATYRLDGPAPPEAKSTQLAPDVVMDRLRSLSHSLGAAAPDGDQDDRTRAVLARLQELSHHPAPAIVGPEQQAAAPPRESNSRPPISPEAMLRRMRELSAAKPEAGTRAEGPTGKPGEPPESVQDVFGGLTHFVSAPELAQAVDHASRNATDAGQ
jgi:hypothetical protein